jgi:surface carbohydrate biosynthesis protein (TIGR04326 family)
MIQGPAETSPAYTDESGASAARRRSETPAPSGDTVIVFDESVSEAALERALRRQSGSKIALFPLTSQWRVIQMADCLCRRQVGNPGDVTMLDAAAFIDEEVDAIRRRVAKWSADLGRATIGGRRLCEWLFLGKEGVSTWWFSGLAEKNTMKTNTFFQMAQLHGFEAAVRSGCYRQCIVAHGNIRLRRGFSRVAKRCGVAVLSIRGNRRIPGSGNLKSIWTIGKSLVRAVSASGWVGALAAGAGVLARSCWRSHLARAAVRRVETETVEHDSILLVTYFPNVERPAADQGVFRNRMTGSLQDALPGGKTTWICLYIPYEDISYKDAVQLAAVFRCNGLSIHMLEEFTTVAGIARVMYYWLRNSFVYLSLRSRLRQRVWQGISIPESASLLTVLLDDSFLGSTAISSLIFLEWFKQIFVRWHGAKYCLYWLEMCAWEKALNAAGERYGSATKRIGFQHTHVTRNHFNYIWDPSETDGEFPASTLPLPNIIACNGDIPLNYLRQWGVKHLRKVEAVRHLYLKTILEQESEETERAASGRVLLLAGSIIAEETSALLSFLHSAFPDGTDFHVWLKGHPACPVGPLLERLPGGLKGHHGWEIRDEPVAKLLPASRIVLVGGSSVAVDALAHKCAVVVPVLAECMFMTPLAGFEEYYFRCTGPGQFRAFVENLMAGNESPARHSAAPLVQQFWCLDESLTLWKKLLV